LTLTGMAAVDATGNALANMLTGNGAANRLDGKAGSDAMRGGAGDDTYVVDQAGDEISEVSVGGTDTVLASASYDLGGRYVEKLTLTGTAAIDATGNSLDNVLSGNGAANRLDGKAGSDEMRGGAGDDTYVVDQAGDRVYERNGEGIDTVLSSVSYDLAGQYIENLTLTGTSAIDGTGNSLDNSLTGNNSANVLDGGAGNDILRGNGGNDIFSFSTSPGLVADPDIIRDFSAVAGNSDSIRLDHHAFIALSAAPMLSAAEFKDLALGAKDGSDRILYDSTRGNLYYDADGSGSIQAVKFAHLDNHATLTNADFSVI
jgi:Ca2+-binding RTX toxin-like protein